MRLPPEANRPTPRLHAARVIALTAAAWLQGAALAQAYWDPFASPEVSESQELRQDAGLPAPGPVDASTIARLLGEAEAAYAAGRWPQAMEAFKAVTAFDAGSPQAWLRIGNLHHRRGQLLAAASAYRKAAGPPTDRPQAAAHGRQPPTPPDRRHAATVHREAAASIELRTKALVNLASVNLELALAALDEAEAAMAGSNTTPRSLRDAHGEAKAEAATLASRIDGMAGESPMQARLRPGTQGGERAGARTGNRGGEQGVSPAGVQGGTHDARPQAARTVRNWQPSASASASASASPLSPSLPPSGSVPAPGLDATRPTIEYLRGAPRP